MPHYGVFSFMGLILKLPKDVLKLLFCKLCFVLDFEALLRLRLVCKTFEEIIHSNVVTESWSNRFIKYDLWRMRNTAVVPLVGNYDLKLVTDRCHRVGIDFRDDEIWFSVRAVQLLLYGMERAVLYHLRGERRFYFSCSLLNSCPRSPFYSDFANNDLMFLEDIPLQDSSSDGTYVPEKDLSDDEDSLEYGQEYSDGDSEFEFEERFLQELAHKPSSLNRLHVRLSLFSHFACLKEDDPESWELFFESCKKDLQTHESLINEPCSVTGVTPLMLLWRDLDFFNDYGMCDEICRSTELIGCLNDIAMAHGANINAQDKKGFSVFDYLCFHNVNVATLMTDVESAIHPKYGEDIAWQPFVLCTRHLLKSGLDIDFVKRRLDLFPELVSFLDELPGDVKLIPFETGCLSPYRMEPVIAKKYRKMFQSQIPKYCQRAGVQQCESEKEREDIFTICCQSFTMILLGAYTFMEHRRSKVLKPRDMSCSLRSRFV